jgi:hypothetical protein
LWDKNHGKSITTIPSWLPLSGEEGKTSTIDHYRIRGNNTADGARMKKKSEEICERK